MLKERELIPVAVTPDTVLTAVIAVGAAVKSVRVTPVGAALKIVRAVMLIDFVETAATDVNALNGVAANVLELNSMLLMPTVPALERYAPLAVPALLRPVTPVVLIPDSAANVVCAVVVTPEKVVDCDSEFAAPNTATVQVLLP